METTDQSVLVGLAIVSCLVCLCAWRFPCTRTGGSGDPAECLFNNRGEPWYAL